MVAHSTRWNIRLRSYATRSCTLWRYAHALPVHGVVRTA
ncbi:hypothetical protein HNR55_002665 [Acetobacter lovaniensis]|uniref:Uncharacterized protein n=1 Tax=Acetobacter lovaniensis TaxID=104100 RepID=A0A841QHL9_9PROT|nr:hypothetical protein [Acetobacter lovaniensis]